MKVLVIALLTLTVLLSGCATVTPSEPALCSGTSDPRNRHTDALVAHGEAIIGVGAGDVLTSGAALIGALDAGCNQK
jgi:hypothetical protein